MSQVKVLMVRLVDLVLEVILRLNCICPTSVATQYLMTLFRNLTDDVDEDVLSQTFGEFGTMEKVR